MIPLQHATGGDDKVEWGGGDKMEKSGRPEGERQVSKVDIKFTVVDYMCLPEQPRYELIEGDLHLTHAPNAHHQRVSRNIQRYLDRWVLDHGLGELYPAPIDVILSNETVVQPDLLVVLNRKSHIVRDQVEGAPDLVVEVLSSSTSQRDLNLKYRLYARSGVEEYWIADPVRSSISVNRLTDTGYVIYGTYTYDSELTSPLFPGFRLPMAHVFERSASE